MHEDYVERVMATSSSSWGRIASSFRASVFSPFNGWRYYFNHRRTVRAERFMSWVLTSTALRETLLRLAIPTLFVYGAKDLVAPPEVGRAIRDAIATAQSSKTLLIFSRSPGTAQRAEMSPFSRQGGRLPAEPYAVAAPRAFSAWTFAGSRTNTSSCALI